MRVICPSHFVLLDLFILILCPQSADEEGLQTWMVAGKVLNKHSQTVDKVGPPAWRRGEHFKHTSMIRNVTHSLRLGEHLFTTHLQVP
jgi:hypothetical protein